MGTERVLRADRSDLVSSYEFHVRNQRRGDKLWGNWKHVGKRGSSVGLGESLVQVTMVS